MNKNAIQKYAIWARTELIEQVKQRAYQYGISEKGYGDENATVISGRVLSADEKRQRRSFIDEIKKSSYKQAVEEVAYTWFNRFVALRYMEVNDFLPTHIRVFSDPSGNFNPEILTNVLHLDLPGLDKAKVSKLLNTNATEELYRYLLLTQCNALNALLPEMFERMGAYTEMLLPNKILKPESVIGRLVKDIPEEDFRDAVQIIGWLYQYYNTEPKQAVFEGLKKNVKISKENIPAATQLFTPDWIVHYMVENSLGQLWMESHPNTALNANWKYYLNEAEQTPEVAKHLSVLRTENAAKSPEDIKIIDPCMGSGHILVYAFDVLMQIYTSEGYSQRDAAKLILEKNLYGLEIDRRAHQLAYFALMMKAQHHNRRILTLGVRPQVYEPTGYWDGMEYGSLVKIDSPGKEPQEKAFGEQIELEDNYERDLRVWNFKRLLSQKYDVVVTNPPYMGRKSLNERISAYIEENYKLGKAEFYSAFMLKCFDFAKISGYVAMITMHTWMFISSFEKLRKFLLANTRFVSMVHTGAATFEELNSFNVLATSFVYKKNEITDDYKTTFLRLTNYYNTQDKIVNFNNNDDRYYVKQKNLELISEQPFIYWFTENTYRLFEKSQKIREFGALTNGLFTCDNNRFVRNWFEVSVDKIQFNSHDSEEAARSGKKWFPYIKGGKYCKWYGNNEFVVNYKLNGSEIRNYRVQQGQSKSFPGEAYYFKPGITWAPFGFENFGVRYKEYGSIFDIAGSSLFIDDNDVELYILGFLASKVGFYLLSAMAPTVNFQIGNIGNIPLLVNDKYKIIIVELVKENISIAKTSWNSYEESWNFCLHPLMQNVNKIEIAYKQWEQINSSWYNIVKRNEEEMNEYFSEIYGLFAEIEKEVTDRDISIRKADVFTDTKSFISYAVGCMFGRYSLEVEGLSYAGGQWDNSKNSTYIADKNNVIPICDDEYFDGDILGRFIDFVKIVYGADTLEENLRFIADALGGKGTPREVIRNYFLNNFYADHCKIYQKRPIYWLFDSGKKNGFKALIYMHRYSRDLLAKLRTDYVHEQQERYRTQLSHISVALNTATGAERARLLKQQDKLSEQAQEISAFEEKVHHLADQNISIDLDDGVKKNYEIFADVLATIG